MKKLLEDFKYLLHVITHPFDGFYEVRFRGKKNVYLGAIILILYGLLAIIKYQYTGFIMNNNPMFRMNSITTFLFGIFPFILFCISNWSVTAIFEAVSFPTYSPLSPTRCSPSWCSTLSSLF